MKKSQAGGGVAVKIEHAVYETAKMAGRHFDENDELVSMISRQSIDVLKVGSYLRTAIYVGFCSRPILGYLPKRREQGRMASHQEPERGQSVCTLAAVYSGSNDHFL